MQTISNKSLENTLYYRDIPAFTYKIDYPFFITTCNMTAAQKINDYYASAAQETGDYCHTVLYPQAVESVRFRPADSPPFHSYELSVSYQITYNFNCMTSLYMDQYNYMGGAHGSTIRRSDTWNFCSGRQLSLADFYPPNFPFTDYILKDLERQTAERLKTSPSTYFDNYAELLRETFRPENYYLKPEGIVIYFQEYDIAPFVTGIPEFLIS